MSKYIDADKLIAEIKGLQCEQGFDTGEAERAYQSAIKDILAFIDTLQQVQPDKYETALEKAREWMPNVNQGGQAILIDIFQELGEGLDPRYGGRKQEQPEVDLEEEMQEEYYKYAIYESGSISGEGYQLEAQGHYECNLTRKEFNYIARHFYELGLNARKEE